MLAFREATSICDPVLAEDDRFSEFDAVHALYMLDNRGRIYSVDDRVRITPLDE